MGYWEMNERFSSCKYNLIPLVPIFTFIPMFCMSKIEVSENNGILWVHRLNFVVLQYIVRRGVKTPHFKNTPHILGNPPPLQILKIPKKLKS